jgi:uroporphyrinogen decarboxylase
MLDRTEYLAWAQPHHQAILRWAVGVPRILFVKEGPHLDLLAASGAEVISLGKRHDLREARQNYPNLTFQGNVDEALLQAGTADQVIEATRQCLRAGGGRRHILNLSHGVDKNTPVANFEAYVRTAKEWV